MSDENWDIKTEKWVSKNQTGPKPSQSLLLTRDNSMKWRKGEVSIDLRPKSWYRELMTRWSGPSFVKVMDRFKFNVDWKLWIDLNLM